METPPGRSDRRDRPGGKVNRAQIIGAILASLIPLLLAVGAPMALRAAHVGGTDQRTVHYYSNGQHGR